MVNQFNGIGRLVRDPELKVVGNGSEIVNFTIASSEKYTDKSGNKQESTEFINCFAWGKPASIINQFCKKGSLLYISGKLKTEKWEKENQTHYSTKVNVFQFQFLDSKGSQQQGGYQKPQNKSSNNWQSENNHQGPTDDFVEDGIPF